ncbi:MAG TPA: Nif11-like leader peptide family natural product precursor [Thermoanaerobaculia bacterium]|nr:Nif11-like leader peptide family natural product precursor [Thermoanaerobaculia bacterium]
MSRPDLERLIADLRKHPHLLQELREHGSVAWARDRGYDVTREELMELMDGDRELSDDELEQAAGGDDGWGTGTGGGTGGTGGTTGGGGGG